MAGTGEVLGDEAHLDRRAAEAVDQQNAHPAALYEQAAVGRLSIDFRLSIRL
jgi:hypothetical protein